MITVVTTWTTLAGVRKSLNPWELQNRNAKRFSITDRFRVLSLLLFVPCLCNEGKLSLQFWLEPELKKTHLENVFVNMVNSLQKSVSFFFTWWTLQEKKNFQNVSPWCFNLRLFHLWKQTPFLLSIYSFVFSVKDSKFLSLFFGELTRWWLFSKVFL